MPESARLHKHYREVVRPKLRSELGLASDMATAAGNAALAIGDVTRYTEMRHRLLFLLGALVVYRIGTFVPVPGIDPIALARLFDRQEGTILGLFNMAAVEDFFERIQRAGADVAIDHPEGAEGETRHCRGAAGRVGRTHVVRATGLGWRLFESGDSALAFGILCSAANPQLSLDSLCPEAYLQHQAASASAWGSVASSS